MDEFQYQVALHRLVEGVHAFGRIKGDHQHAGGMQGGVQGLVQRAAVGLASVGVVVDVSSSVPGAERLRRAFRDRAAAAYAAAGMQTQSLSDEESASGAKVPAPLLR